MKHILLLSTGGTIASRPGSDGLEPEMSRGRSFFPALETSGEDFRWRSSRS